MKILHICVIHRPFDARIFGKECRTLAEAGHDVHLVAPATQTLRKDGVTIHPINKADPKVISVLKSLISAYRSAASLKADVYHLHEPLLIPVGIILKIIGAKVIYDAHEDAPLQAKSVGRNQNRPLLGLFLSFAWSVLESASRYILDAFVCATPAIARRFPKAKTITVLNLPRLEDFALVDSRSVETPYSDRDNHVVYAGGISKTRGIIEMLHAMNLLPDSLHAELILLGKFAPSGLKAQIEKVSGWSRTVFSGWRDHTEVIKEFKKAKIGIVVLHPEPNYLESWPVKLFEYMAAGLPVVASDFPLWQGIIEQTNCGLCVNPTDPQAIANAIEYLLEHPEEAEAMGRNGQAAVRSTYNWSSQTGEFLALYRRLGER